MNLNLKHNTLQRLIKTKKNILYGRYLLLLKVFEAYEARGIEAYYFLAIKDTTWE